MINSDAILRLIDMNSKILVSVEDLITALSAVQSMEQAVDPRYGAMVLLMNVQNTIRELSELSIDWRRQQDDR